MAEHGFHELWPNMSRYLSGRLKTVPSLVCSSSLFLLQSRTVNRGESKLAMDSVNAILEITNNREDSMLVMD